MKEYSGKTRIKKWWDTYEDPLLMVVFLAIPSIIIILAVSYLLWRF